jgi:hypothetical protein
MSSELTYLATSPFSLAIYMHASSHINCMHVGPKAKSKIFKHTVHMYILQGKGHLERSTNAFAAGDTFFLSRSRI